MTAKNGETIHILDASGYIFRAYFGIKASLTTREGLPTNAVYGFTRMLLKLIQEQAPTHLVPVFDVSRRSFRNEIYPEYKANRPPPPEDLIPQFPLVREVVQAFGLPALELENFEADDVIGTLARRFENEGYRVVIVTSDKDMAQLVNENVTILNTNRKDEWFTLGPAGVREKFGVSPENIVDWLGLAGDSSDNVPGVPGVGPKTAAGLIQEFGSMESVLENIDSVKGKKRQENLRENTEQARLSKKLVTIRRDAPIAFDLEDAKLEPPDPKRLAPLFEKLEFQKLLESLSVSERVSVLDRETYQRIDTPETLEDLIAELRRAEIIAFDTETKSCDALQPDGLVGMSFSTRTGKACYLPLSHDAGAKRQLDKAETLRLLRPIFEDPGRRWVMQNAKFDLAVLETEDVRVAGMVDDTMLLSYVLDPARRGHGLDALAKEYLNHDMISFQEVAGKGKDQLSFDQVDLDSATRYAAEDADATFQLYTILKSKVEADDLWRLYQTLERPLVPVLARMERNGFRLDRASLEAMTAAFDALLASMEAEIFELAGESFNINSTQQLGAILFEKLALPQGRKTKTGYSTDSSVLTKLSVRHPLPEKVLEYRQAAKLRSTYTDALLRQINPETDRIHTSFNQTVTLTGRLSSSNPNLQNIPVRTEAGRMIRKAFVPEEGNLLLAADYSQVELRILAHMAEDPILIDSFEKGEDIHTRTAAEVFDTMAAFVDRDMRRKAKAVNFGIVYGQTAYGLSESLGIGRGEAAKIIERYFERYAGVRAYIDSQQERGRIEKQVFTLFGRRIPLRDIDSPNASVRNYSERLAINAPIQGSAADIIKKAMIAIHGKLKDAFPKARMLLQVHDELIFEAPETEIEELKSFVVREMEGAADLTVPLKVDVGVGKNWDEAH